LYLSSPYINQEFEMKRGLFLGICMALLPVLGFAQSGGALRWIVPYPAGGGSDVIARSIADAMQKNFDRPIVIENRPGGATNIAAEVTANAKPDGTTIMSADNASLMFNQFLFTKLAYDPQKSFSYVSGIGRFPMVLIVNPAFSAKSLQEFISVAKVRPGAIDYASPGNGSAHHVTMEMFKQKAGISLTHIPYRGAAPAIQDVMAGQIPAMMIDLAVGLPAIKSGKVRALAIASTKRATALPDLPTFDELGVRGVDGYALQAVIAPAGMPAATIQKLNQSINQAINDPSTTKRLLDFGADLMVGTPEQLEKFVSLEREKWALVIRNAGVRLD
jgi:tripartite-type tricarboxylate transporter receptor subunit TctC